MPLSDVATRMLDTYPRTFDVDRDLLLRCIEACADCAQACTQCADDCLSETAGSWTSPSASGWTSTAPTSARPPRA